jgi:hypothetical protein
VDVVVDGFVDVLVDAVAGTGGLELLGLIECLLLRLLEEENVTGGLTI